MENISVGILIRARSNVFCALVLRLLKFCEAGGYSFFPQHNTISSDIQTKQSTWVNLKNSKICHVVISVEWGFFVLSKVTRLERRFDFVFLLERMLNLKTWSFFNSCVGNGCVLLSGLRKIRVLEQIISAI